MPNHIQNRIEIIGTPAQVKKVLTSIAASDKDGESLQIDFNKIVPMPEGLNASPHSGVKTWVEICTGQIDFSVLFTGLPASTKVLFESKSFGILANSLSATTAMETITGKRKGNVKDFSDEDFNCFIQCLKNYRQFGSTSWYEWSIKNWGTKWNAYGQNDKRNNNNTIYFQIAWSSPLSLIGELSKLFPDLIIKLDYADEDSGSNTGKITFKAGDPIEVIQPESQSNEGYEIYFELNPDSVNDYQMVNGKWEYKDEE